MASKPDKMDLMHELLAKNFLDMLKNGVEYVDREGEIKYRKCNASELNAIRQFLKDNNISADAEFNNQIKELNEELPFITDNVVNFRN